MDAVREIAAKLSELTCPPVRAPAAAPPADVISAVEIVGPPGGRPHRKVTSPLPQLETLTKVSSTDTTSVCGAPSGSAIRTGSIETPPTESAEFADCADWAVFAEVAM